MDNISPWIALFLIFAGCSGPKDPPDSEGRAATAESSSEGELKTKAGARIVVDVKVPSGASRAHFDLRVQNCDDRFDLCRRELWTDRPLQTPELSGRRYDVQLRTEVGYILRRWENVEVTPGETRDLGSVDSRGELLSYDIEARLHPKLNPRRLLWYAAPVDGELRFHPVRRRTQRIQLLHPRRPLRVLIWSGGLGGREFIVGEPKSSLDFETGIVVPVGVHENVSPEPPLRDLTLTFRRLGASEETPVALIGVSKRPRRVLLPGSGRYEVRLRGFHQGLVERWRHLEAESPLQTIEVKEPQGDLHEPLLIRLDQRHINDLHRRARALPDAF